MQMKGCSGGVLLGVSDTADPPPMCPPTKVERRRRDKINNWIVQLSKIIPDCSMENTKSGQVGTPQMGRRGGSPVCPAPP